MGFNRNSDIKDGVGGNIEVLILAGGNSRRMGQDKALLTYGGQPLLARTVALVQPWRVSVLTPWPDRYRDIIGDPCRWLPENHQDRQGPLVALQRIWGEFSSPWLLVLACDLPYLTPHALHRWAQGLATVPDQAIACLPYHGGYWQSLCGFYHQRGRASLDAYIAGGGRSFQGWLRGERVTAIVEDDPQLWHNCNRPDDLPQTPIPDPQNPETQTRTKPFLTNVSSG